MPDIISDFPDIKRRANLLSEPTVPFTYVPEVVDLSHVGWADTAPCEYAAADFDVA